MQWLPSLQDIGEAKKYLNLLNGKTAFSVALVIFNIGSAAIIGTPVSDTLLPCPTCVTLPLPHPCVIPPPAPPV